MDQVTIELARHSVAEEIQVYPAVKDEVSADEAERAKKEHAEAEETLQRLSGLDPQDPSFDDEPATLMRGIREHAAADVVTRYDGCSSPTSRERHTVS